MGADTLARLHGTALPAIETSARFSELVRRHTCAGCCSRAEVTGATVRADLVGVRAAGLGDCAVGSGDGVASSRGGEHHVNRVLERPLAHVVRTSCALGSNRNVLCFPCEINF